MREPWLVLVPTWARADGLSGTPGMSPALNYSITITITYSNWSLATYPFFSSSKLIFMQLPPIYLLYLSIYLSFTRPHVLISALSMHLPPVLWAWIRVPATHFLGARILTTLTLSTPPAAFSALPQHLPSPSSVIVLSSQYLFQLGPIWLEERNGYVAIDQLLYGL